jgi:hypothetical protein
VSGPLLMEAFKGQKTDQRYASRDRKAKRCAKCRCLVTSVEAGNYCYDCEGPMVRVEANGDRAGFRYG